MFSQTAVVISGRLCCRGYRACLRSGIGRVISLVIYLVSGSQAGGREGLAATGWVPVAAR